MVNHDFQFYRSQSCKTHRPDVDLNTRSITTADSRYLRCTFPERASLYEIARRNHSDTARSFHCGNASEEMKDQAFIILKKFRPATFDISDSLYPLFLSSSKSFGNREISSSPEGVISIPSKSDPIPT